MGEEYEQLLIDHRRILSDRFENHMGVVVYTQGDAFFVAFQRAQDAVAAAVEVNARWLSVDGREGEPRGCGWQYTLGSPPM